MKQYKYSLDKSSKKFICPNPNCGKRTFVKYVETETRSYLSDEFGRCDRESKCGYHRAPKGEYQNTFETKYIPKPEPSFHSYDLVSQSSRNFKENIFIQILRKHFSKDEVQQAILKYSIGTSKYWKGATVFWQIDNQQNIRHGKIMLYDFDTGKRKKKADGSPYFNSVRIVLKLNNFILSQCLFGLHLINETNQKPIALVESEKTAVIMSIVRPQYIWLATGGKGFFNFEMLKPIKDFNFIAFPDKSEFENWRKKAIELNEVGFKIIVNRWVEETDYKDGTDFADVYLNLIESKNKPAEPQIQYTPTEQAVHKLEEHTPDIRLLIETFDLTDEFGNEIRPKPKTTQKPQKI